MPGITSVTASFSSASCRDEVPLRSAGLDRILDRTIGRRLRLYDGIDGTSSRVPPQIRSTNCGWQYEGTAAPIAAAVVDGGTRAAERPGRFASYTRGEDPAGNGAQPGHRPTQAAAPRVHLASASRPNTKLGYGIPRHSGWLSAAARGSAAVWFRRAGPLVVRVAAPPGTSRHASGSST